MRCPALRVVTLRAALTTGGDTPRQPGQREMTLSADPNDMENITISLPPQFMIKVIKKVDTTDHYDPRRKIMPKNGG